MRTNVYFIGLAICVSFVYAKDSKNSPNVLQDITVTANKVEENIKDVPQSISVIDSFLLEEKGVKTVGDAIKYVPNMKTVPSFGKSINFRGLNSSIFTNNNPVVIYIDGVPTTNRYFAETSLQNVERIEVLRGPQGTLYGKDAIGGVINIITKKPTNDLKANLGVEYGSYNYMLGNFNVSSPIIDDKLFFNLNGELKSYDGWVTNTYNNDDKATKEKSNSLATSLMYKITDRLSAKASFKKEYSKNFWGFGQSVLGATSLSQFSKKQAENISFDAPSFDKVDTFSQSLHVKYEADNYTIDATSVHKKSELESVFDVDFSSNNGNYDGLKMFRTFNKDNYSQEIKVSNNSNKRIRWIGGLFLDIEKENQAPYGQEYPTKKASRYMNSESKTDGTTMAVFSQAMIALGDKFDLTLGGRYQKIKKKFNLSMYDLEIGTPTNSSNSFYKFDDEKTWNAFLPKAALTYKINNVLTSYVSFSKGYMPGGFNYFTMSGTKEDNRFKPEQTTNYEIGVKGALENLTFSASVFRMDIKDIHIYKQYAGGYLTDNAKKAHSQGIEFDFTYFPINEIEIDGAFGFIDAKYDDYDAGSIKFDDKHIQDTATHTANLGIAYYHPSGYYARADINHVGNVYFYDDKNKKFLKEKPYTTADIKIGYKFKDFDLFAYVNNITDEEYITTYWTNSLAGIATFGKPRFFGAGIKYSF